MIKLWSEITSGSSTICEGPYCFTKTLLLKMGCEISGWRFLKVRFFYAGFYCIKVTHNKFRDFSYNLMPN